MARQVANVDIITDSFEVWLLQTNELLNAFSTEIITANTTYANTGNSTISRTAQLWGTFGSNNVVVTTGLRGGNVNGLSANLVITTNATAYVASDAGIRVLAGNSSSNSFLNPVGVYLGLGTANSIVNSSLIITQSNSTVNTSISSNLIQIANSTSTANITPIAFRTGLFNGNTTVVAVGANVYGNATSLYVGNSTFDSVFGNGSWTGVANLVITPTNYLTVAGAANIVSNANFANTIAVTGNATLSNTLSVTGSTTLANTLAVTGNTTLSNTLAVTGAATLANTLGVTGLTTASGNLNTPTANASVAVNVGANVNLTTARINVGNSTVNTSITATAVDIDGTLDVLRATSLSNTLTIAGLANAAGNLNAPTINASSIVNVGANVTLTTTQVGVGNSTVNTSITSNTITITNGGLAVNGNTNLSGAINLNSPATFQTDYVVDVASNTNVGPTLGAVLVYRFPKATYASGKFEVQVKNGNTQLSELVLAHDGGLNAFVTTYGTVASNGGSSPLGTFIANTDTANVNLYLVQTVANSAVKVVAHLIK